MIILCSAMDGKICSLMQLNPAISMTMQLTCNFQRHRQKWDLTS